VASDGSRVDIIPLDAIDQVAGWDNTIRAAGCPVFYTTQFLRSVATTPLLESQSASLLVLDDAVGFAGVPVFQQNRVDVIRLLLPLRDKFPDLAERSGLLSHCWHCYDSRIVSARGEDRLHRLVEGLRRHAQALHTDYFGFVNVSDPLTLDIMEQAGIAPHYMTDRHIMGIGNYRAFEDYVAALQPDARRELRRQYKHYAASPAELAIEQPPFDNLDEVARLCRNTAARYDAEFYYPDGPLQFLLANLGATRLISIRIGGERIGVLICFFDPPRFHIWAAGMRYDRSRFSPYAVAMAEAIKYAIASRLTVIEGGRGNARIKKKQGFVPLKLYACLQRAVA
jgi:hypothetical protein